MTSPLQGTDLFKALKNPYPVKCNVYTVYCTIIVYRQKKLKWIIRLTNLRGVRDIIHSYFGFASVIINNYHLGPAGLDNNFPYPSHLRLLTYHYWKLNKIKYLYYNYNQIKGLINRLP